MIQFRNAVLCCLLTFLSVAVIGQPTDTLKQIDALFAGWNNATPGGAILVTRNGRELYHKAFGLADLEHNVPNTTETVFESGSVAKQFTAMSILILAQEGKLNLQDEVQKYVPEVPRYNAPVRIHHLLNHTSGLKDWGSIGGLSGWPRTTRVYTQDLALKIIARQKSTNFTPGMEYSYSNSNYTLLVTIVERVSGKSLSDFTRERFFVPLGMTHTQWRNNFRQVVPNRAIAYNLKDGNYQQLMPFENIHGHGGLLTTTADLDKWNALLANHNIGGEGVYKERIRRGILTQGKQISYASGLVVENFHGHPSISHSGATAGYRAWLAWYPEKKISVAIVSNDAASDVVASGNKIAELYLGKDQKPQSGKNSKSVSFSGADAERFAGVYRSARGFDVMKLEVKDGSVVSNGHALIPAHRDTLYFEGTTWAWVRPGVVLQKNASDTATYRKISSYRLDPQQSKKLEGRYFSEEAEAEYIITVKGNDVWLTIPNGEPFQLQPAFADGYTGPERELYEFHRDRGGLITGFDLSLSRAYHVPFKKTSIKP